MAEALNLVKGSGIELTKNAADNTLTISATGASVSGMAYDTWSIESSTGINRKPTTSEVNFILYAVGTTEDRGYATNISTFIKTSSRTYSVKDGPSFRTVHSTTFTKISGSTTYTTITYSDSTGTYDWTIS